MRLRLAFPFLAAFALSLAACDWVGGGDDDAPVVARASSIVTVAYTGTLADSTVFDQSDRARFSLQRVIPGFREGIVGMRVDSTRTFDVPPEEGYGEEGVVNANTGEVIIPPNATLTFEVTLLGVE